MSIIENHEGFKLIKTYTYDAEANFIPEEYFEGNEDYNYTYDSMNRPFKNIDHSEFFELFSNATYKNNV